MTEKLNEQELNESYKIRLEIIEEEKWNLESELKNKQKEIEKLNNETDEYLK